jgi:hypothetical protein
MFKQKFHHNKIVDFTLKAIVLSELVLIVFGLGVVIISLINGDFSDASFGIYR